MMKITDTQVVAYVDDELPEAERAAVEAAAAADPVLAARIARHKALRRRVSGAFAGVLGEPAPDALVGLIAAAGPGRPAAASDNVVDLARARSDRAAPVPRARPVWAAWAAFAACVALAVVMLQLRPASPGGQTIAVTGGTMTAKGVLAHALDRQLASDPGSVEPGVKVLVSFKSADGRYCRSFQLDQGSGLAGVACRTDGGWTVVTAAAASAGQPTGAYHTAGGALPTAVTDTVDGMIAGRPLDAVGEKAAQAKGWSR